MSLARFWLFFVLCGAVIWAQPAAEGDGIPSNPDPAAKAIDPATKSLRIAEPSDKAVDWKGFVRQSTLFLGIQHGFRLATEPGTRSGMKGPFWQGYADSVGNMHGWGDGDVFYVNYVGHPLQGAASGYIYIQNDPVARKLRFAQDRRYWTTRLKAMGASWAYSTWFEIGPISEASIGKIQNRRPQQGFVDHVVTPIIGTGWILAEDFLDEKVILPFERRFRSPMARILVRGWLNPSRSFSNMMALRVPWHRDNRAGVPRSIDPAPYLLEPEAPRVFPKEAPFEMTALPYWARFDGTQCAGGGGQAAFKLSANWQLVGQLSGCQLRDLRPNRTGDMLTYAVGPRWTPQAGRRVSPFAQLLVGGNKITRYEIDPARKALLEVQALRAGTEAPAQELYTTQLIRHGVTMVAGTGVDVRLHPAFALRLASVEYAKSWAGTVDGRNYAEGLQLSSGVILRMGTW